MAARVIGRIAICLVWESWWFSCCCIYHCSLIILTNSQVQSIFFEGDLTRRDCPRRIVPLVVIKYGFTLKLLVFGVPVILTSNLKNLKNVIITYSCSKYQTQKFLYGHSNWSFFIQWVDLPQKNVSLKVEQTFPSRSSFILLWRFDIETNSGALYY